MIFSYGKTSKISEIVSHSSQKLVDVAIQISRGKTRVSLNESAWVPINRYRELGKKLTKFLLIIGLNLTFMVGVGWGRAATRDLSGWNFSTQPTVELDGEWEFYWRQLLTPDTISAHIHQRKLIDFKTSWSSGPTEGLDLDPNSFATYRLLVIPPREERVLRVYLKDVPTAYKLWINGKAIVEYGKVGISEEASIPEVGHRAFSFISKGEPLEFVMQVSSFHHRSGGMWHNIRLGLDEPMRASESFHKEVDVFVMSALLIMSLYHLFLFAICSFHF